MGSFVDDLLDNLEPDIATALGIASTQVYRGRSPRDPIGPALEVWVEPIETRSELTGLAGLVAHEVRLHPRVMTPREGTKTGGVQHDTVRDSLQTLRRRYDGARPFSGVAALADMVMLQCSDEAPSDGGGRRELIEARLTLVALERA